MRKMALITMMSLALAVPAGAYEAFENDRESSEYMQVQLRRHGLRYELNHLNRMLAHVKWQARRYGASRHIWREIASASAQVDRVNHKARFWFYDRYQLRRQIARIHAFLHHIERELRLRPHHFYRWN